MKYKFFLLILLFVIAYSCKSSGAIEESVILKTKEPLENNYRPKKLYKTPSDIENLDSIVKSKKNPFHNGVDMSAPDNGQRHARSRRWNENTGIR